MDSLFNFLIHKWNRNSRKSKNANGRRLKRDKAPRQAVHISRETNDSAEFAMQKINTPPSHWKWKFDHPHHHMWKHHKFEMELSMFGGRLFRFRVGRYPLDVQSERKCYANASILLPFPFERTCEQWTTSKWTLCAVGVLWTKDMIKKSR